MHLRDEQLLTASCAFGKARTKATYVHTVRGSRLEEGSPVGLLWVIGGGDCSHCQRSEAPSLP